MAADAAPAFVLLDRLPAVGEEVRLEGDEAHYVSRVVRARSGELVKATDGRGTVATLEVIESRPEVRLVAISVSVVAAPALRTLWCGAPEGDRADWMVEKLAELGVGRLVLVDFERASWERAGARMERWRRLAAAGLRQSQSAFRMAIEQPVPLPTLLAEPSAGETRWVAVPGAQRRAGGQEALSGPVTGAIGPSPGFSDSEANSLREAGFVPVSLGPSRLRTETAALALAVCWQVAGPPQD